MEMHASSGYTASQTLWRTALLRSAPIVNNPSENCTALSAPDSQSGRLAHTERLPFTSNPCTHMCSGLVWRQLLACSQIAGAFTWLAD
jgi:hypothetical protein